MIITTTVAAVSSETRQIADRIAEDFEERKGRRDIRRLAYLLGRETLLELAADAKLAIAAETPVTRRLDGATRTPGGVFFKVAKGWIVGQLREGTQVPKERRQTLYRALSLFRTSGPSKTIPTQASPTLPSAPSFEMKSEPRRKTA